MKRRAISSLVLYMVLTVPFSACQSNPAETKGPTENVCQNRDVVFGVSHLDDGTAIDRVMDVYAPAQSGKDRPAIVFLHGNPGDSPYPGNRQHGFRSMVNHFAPKGYVCFVVAWDLRHGGDKAFEIIEMAVSHIRANAGRYGLAPDRIAVLGHSYGSRHACTLATANFVKESARVQACVMLAGGMSYPEDCDAGDPPVLLVYGTADEWFPQAHGIVSALQRGNVPHAYFEVPGAGHSIPLTAEIGFGKSLGEVIGDFLDNTLAGTTGTTQANNASLKMLVATRQGNGTVEMNNGPSYGMYPAGAKVKLTAKPDPDSAFSGWEGDATGSANPITFTIDANKRLRAIFERQSQQHE